MAEVARRQPGRLGTQEAPPFGARLSGCRAETGRGQNASDRAIAATLSAGNGIVRWALSRTAATCLLFGLGGPAHVAAPGVLVTGICLLATGMGLVPRWFGIAGLVVAVLAVLSLVVLIRPEATVFIPLGGFRPCGGWSR